MGGIGERRGPDPVEAAFLREQQQERAARTAAAEQAAQQAAAEKQELVAAVGTARESVSAAAGGLADVQAPTADELRTALSTAFAAQQATRQTAAERTEAGRPEAEVQDLRQAENRQTNETLIQSVRAWSNQMGQTTAAIGAAESHLQTARATLDGRAATAPEALRPDLERLRGALEAHQESFASLRGNLERMSERADSAADYTPVPQKVSANGAVTLGDTMSTEELVVDVPGDLDRRLQNSTPREAIDAIRSDLDTTVSELDQLSSRIEDAGPAAASTGQGTQLGQGARDSAHRDTRATPRGQSTAL
jgi:hypothetical protein